MIIIFLVTTYILLYYRVLERKIKKKITAVLTADPWMWLFGSILDGVLPVD